MCQEDQREWNHKKHGATPESAPQYSGWETDPQQCSIHLGVEHHVEDAKILAERIQMEVSWVGLGFRTLDSSC